MAGGVYLARKRILSMGYELRLENAQIEYEIASLPRHSGDARCVGAYSSARGSAGTESGPPSFFSRRQSSSARWKRSCEVSDALLHVGRASFSRQVPDGVEGGRGID